MSSPQLPAVRGNNGLRGVLLDAPPAGADPNQFVRVRLDDGRELRLPFSVLAAEQGGYFLALGLPNVPPPSQTQQTIVPVLAEELVVTKQSVPTGGIRVHKRVEQHEELVDMPLVKEHVDIRRVVIDRDVDGPLPVRYEGNTTIISLVEEVLVVEKRLRLKEELHITRNLREERYQERVVLQRERAEVERVDAQGNPVGAAEIKDAELPPALPVQPKLPVETRTPIRRNRVIHLE